jgi:hypothetical protein
VVGQEVDDPTEVDLESVVHERAQRSAPRVARVDSQRVLERASVPACGVRAYEPLDAHTPGYSLLRPP